MRGPPRNRVAKLRGRAERAAQGRTDGHRASRVFPRFYLPFPAQRVYCSTMENSRHSKLTARAGEWGKLAKRTGMRRAAAKRARRAARKNLKKLLDSAAR